MVPTLLDVGVGGVVGVVAVRISTGNRTANLAVLRRLLWVHVTHQHGDLFGCQAHGAWRRFLFDLTIKLPIERGFGSSMVASTEVAFDLLKFTLFKLAPVTRAVVRDMRIAGSCSRLGRWIWNRCAFRNSELGRYTRNERSVRMQPNVVLHSEFV
jgi:hypothetical protein